MASGGFFEVKSSGPFSVTSPGHQQGPNFTQTMSPSLYFGHSSSLILSRSLKHDDSSCLKFKKSSENPKTVTFCRGLLFRWHYYRDL
jgi:hypothetical protein